MRQQTHQKGKLLLENLARKRSKIMFLTSLGALVFVIMVLFSATLTTFSPFSILLVMLVFVMIAGQLLVGYQYSFTYPLYFLSCSLSVAVALFFWTAIRGISVFYLLIIPYLAIVIIVHLMIRERQVMFDNSSTFSIILFALMFVLSSGSLSQSAIDTFFGASIVLFSLVAIPLLNTAYRTAILNRELKIRNIDDYIENSRKKLLAKFSAKSEDVEMLLYYTEHALNSFIEGYFEESFMEAYKIVFDDQREAFKEIYILPKTSEGAKFSEIRAKLAHAKGRKSNLKEVKENKKKLYKNTLHLIKILKLEFIDKAIDSKLESPETLVNNIQVKASNKKMKK